MSKFWDKLSDVHKEQLKNGMRGFRNTVATRYFTNGKNNTEEYIKSIAVHVKNIDIDDSMFGDPVATEINSYKVTQDLINSIYEIEGMNLDFNKISSVCEIGAGYGRTAYVLLKKFPHLKYTIIDIPPAIDLAKENLKEFGVTFIQAPGELLGADLYIAISILTELSNKEIADYFKMFATGKYLYFRDWKKKKNYTNGTTFHYDDNFPIPKTWERVFRRNDPIMNNFYDELYRIH
jgi:hypothetical protein